MMPGVQLQSSSVTGALIGLAVALSAGGCADQVAQYQPPLFMDRGAPVVAGTATADEMTTSTAGTGEDAGSDWTKRTYVYRGGRDPKTGLARTQL
jgi:hypothetical protein